MSPGRFGRAPRRAGLPRLLLIRTATPYTGGFFFAEHPELEAPKACIIWHSDMDPGVLRAIAVPAGTRDPERIDPDQLARWLTVAVGADGIEHAVLSDGWHHIRLDVEAGSLAGGAPVVLHYRLHGLRSAETRILPLRRFLHLCRYRRFAVSLFPADKRVPRGVALLQVHDALDAGASQREIAQVLFGDQRVEADWRQSSDSLRSLVRRLVKDARAMARGGYRSIMRRSR